MPLPRAILFATDFSPSADQAWEVACQLARACGARIIVLHVIPTQIAGYETVLQGLPVRQYRQQAEQALNKYHHSDITVERHIVEGDPAETIVRVAQETDADCIVIGTHGYGFITRVLLGSVAEKVLRQAQGLVLVVRPRASQTGTK